MESDGLEPDDDTKDSEWQETAWKSAQQGDPVEGSGWKGAASQSVRQEGDAKGSEWNEASWKSAKLGRCLRIFQTLRKIVLSRLLRAVCETRLPRHRLPSNSARRFDGFALLPGHHLTYTS